MLGDSDDFLCDDLTELEAAAGLPPYPDDTRLDLSDDGGDWQPTPWGYRLTLLVAAVLAAVVAFGFFCRTG